MHGLDEETHLQHQLLAVVGEGLLQLAVQSEVLAVWASLNTLVCRKQADRVM